METPTPVWVTGGLTGKHSGSGVRREENWGLRAICKLMISIPLKGAWLRASGLQGVQAGSLGLSFAYMRGFGSSGGHQYTVGQGTHYDGYYELNCVLPPSPNLYVKALTYNMTIFGDKA